MNKHSEKRSIGNGRRKDERPASPDSSSASPNEDRRKTSQGRRKNGSGGKSSSHYHSNEEEDDRKMDASSAAEESDTSLDLATPLSEWIKGPGASRQPVDINSSFHSEKQLSTSSDTMLSSQVSLTSGFTPSVFGALKDLQKVNKDRESALTKDDELQGDEVVGNVVVSKEEDDTTKLKIQPVLPRLEEVVNKPAEPASSTLNNGVCHADQSLSSEQTESAGGWEDDDSHSSSEAKSYNSTERRFEELAKGTGSGQFEEDQSESSASSAIGHTFHKPMGNYSQATSQSASDGRVNSPFTTMEDQVDDDESSTDSEVTPSPKAQSNRKVSPWAAAGKRAQSKQQHQRLDQEQREQRRDIQDAMNGQDDLVVRRSKLREYSNTEDHDLENGTVESSNSNSYDQFVPRSRSRDANSLRDHQFSHSAVTAPMGSGMLTENSRDDRHNHSSSRHRKQDERRQSNEYKDKPTPAPPEEGCCCGMVQNKCDAAALISCLVATIALATVIVVFEVFVN